MLNSSRPSSATDERDFVLYETGNVEPNVLDMTADATAIRQLLISTYLSKTRYHNSYLFRILVTSVYGTINNGFSEISVMGCPYYSY